MPTIPRSARSILICAVLPVTFSFFAYFGFITSYTNGLLFTPRVFDLQYENGIYRYRVLGPWLVEGVHALIDEPATDRVIERLLPGRTRLVQRAFGVPSLRLYLAHFLVNTTFLVLTMFALRAVFERGPPRLPAQDLQLLLLLLVMTFSQFVVTPYDTLSYFLLALGIWLLVQPETARNVALLVAVTVVGALTRETTALVLSMYAALYAARDSLGLEKRIATLGLLTVAFAATYLALRMAFGFDSAVGNRITVSDWGVPDLLGGLTFVALGLTLVDLDTPGVRRTAGIFLLFATPYLASIALTGFPSELRLFVPLWIGLSVIGALHAGCANQSASPGRSL
jgi:hypothetical protein